MKRTTVKRILLVALLLLLAVPAMAQDSTAEPAATQEVAVTVEPVVAVDTVATVPIEPVVDAPVVSDIPEAPPSQNDDIQQLVIFGLFGLVAIFQISQVWLARLLSRFLPPEVAQMLVNTGAEWALKASLNQAAKTTSTDDDDYFMAVAKQRGLTVTRNADGTYNLLKVSPIGERAIVAD